MSYIDDFDESESVNKIPYDDTPIYRSSTTKRSVNQTSSGKGFNLKILAICVAILFSFNIFLSVTVFVVAKNSGSKYVNVYPISVTSSDGGISSLAIHKAYWSSVCVAAGGSERKVTDYDSFFSQTSSRGAGVIYEIDEDNSVAYIITCYHVISGYTSEIYVLLPSSLTPIKATLVGSSDQYDIAVLKITDLSTIDGCLEIEKYDTEYLSYGESVVAVGNPLSSGQSTTIGAISNINVEISIDGVTTREIQIDAAINPGNSGGGLYNSSGQFIGLVNAKLNAVTSSGTTYTVEGISYALPGNLVCNIAEKIINNSGTLSALNLGVTFDYGDLVTSVITEDGKSVLKYTVEVSSIQSGSIASGVLQKGDVILSFTFTSISGEEITVEMMNKYTFEDYSFIIARGTRIKFNIRRVNAFAQESELEVYVTASSFSVVKWN